jgi:UDP-N-acetylglucosamine--N-acetylmuramyl-(pentapeptide) pyrophosphoryl-undecaprenol N-acetylglucosamine transferase
VGQALRELDPEVDLLFVGSSHGPEGEIAREQGIPFEAVPSSPLTKSLSLKNMASFGKLCAGVFRARSILKSFRPDAVIGTGGYTSAAILIAARTCGKKVIIHEQNTIPGRTNRWLARIADKVCISFDSSAAFFSKQKVVLTGLPIRSEFKSLPDKSEARKALGLKEDLFTILIVGGSQGARRLNELVMEMWPKINDGKTQVLHQVGQRNFEECKSTESENYHVRAYLDMPQSVAAADLVICRSGASTIAEITAAGLPSILVPYPHAVSDEQKHNAKYLAAHNAGILCEEFSLTSDILKGLVTDLRSSPEKLKAMASASAALAKVDAAKSVAQVAIDG